MPTGVYVRTEAYRQKQREAMARHINPGMNKSEETKRRIGNSQRGRPKSDAFRLKCSERMRGKPSCFKGKKHNPEWVMAMRERLHGLKHWNWKGGIAANKNEYNVGLRRRKNGFDPEVFLTRMAEQRGACAICGVQLTKGLSGCAAAADHDHETGHPRGILCKRCNLMLGHARDDEGILAKAIEYLASWERVA